MIFHLPNVAESPLKGFQAKVVVSSANGWQYGLSKPFNALVDSGARHTCVSEEIMNNVLVKVRDKDGNKLQPAGKARVSGVFGKVKEEPVYILPHFFLGRIHLTNAAVIVLRNSNIDCLIGRSILHQCNLLLDSEKNSMTFDFADSLKSHKQLIDGLPPFESVDLYAESGSGAESTINPDPLKSDA